jgi:P22 tail accessory factor
MSTAGQLIAQALLKIGVTASGETLPADEANEGFIELNQMLDVWSNDGLMIYHVTNYLFDVTPGVSTYSIGPQATWDTGTMKRPMQIQKWGAFVRQTVAPGLTNDYKLEYWPNETYQNVFLKGQTTNFPSRFTYQPGYPIATIILWPVPTIALQFGLSGLDQFQTFSNLTDQVSLPPGYESAIVFNLAINLAPSYGIEPLQTVFKQAFETKSKLMTTNQDSVYMRTDPALEHASRRPFNIYTG